jgi:hypothetical protein
VSCRPAVAPVFSSAVFVTPAGQFRHRLVEPHDIMRHLKPFQAQAFLQQHKGLLPLNRIHLGNSKSLTWVPVDIALAPPLIVTHGEKGFRRLLGTQRVQECCGGAMNRLWRRPLSGAGPAKAEAPAYILRIL